MTNKEFVTGFFMEGYVRHNYDFLLKNMAQNYFDNSPCAARTNLACVNILKNTEKMFADMEVKILDMLEEGNKVAVCVRFTATHNAEAYGVPRTGKQISFEALEIFRIEKGRIAESWGNWPDMQICEMLKKQQRECEVPP